MKNIIICGAIITAVAAILAVLPHTIANEDTSSKVEESICATISFGSGDTIINMEDISEVYDFADTVIIGTITEKEEATMSEVSPFPYIPVKVTVDKVIKGDIAESSIKFMVSGGTVTARTFIENTKSTWERAEKMGLTALSEEEKDTKYVQYISNFKKDYEVGTTYVILLKNVKDGLYTVIDDTGVIELESPYVVDMINSKEDVISITNN